MWRWACGGGSVACGEERGHGKSGARRTETAHGKGLVLFRWKYHFGRGEWKPETSC